MRFCVARCSKTSSCYLLWDVGMYTSNEVDSTRNSTITHIRATCVWYRMQQWPYHDRGMLWTMFIMLTSNEDKTHQRYLRRSMLWKLWSAHTEYGIIGFGYTSYPKYTSHLAPMNRNKYLTRKLKLGALLFAPSHRLMHGERCKRVGMKDHHQALESGKKPYVFHSPKCLRASHLRYLGP